MSTDGTGRIVFCFGVNGYRDEHNENYHPASLYEEGAENPYHHDSDDAEEMIGEAFDALPKPPEEYDCSDAGRGSWVRFDYEGLVSGENIDPIQTDNGMQKNPESEQCNNQSLQTDNDQMEDQQ